MEFNRSIDKSLDAGLNFFEKGLCEYDAKNYSEAIKHFYAALDADPTLLYTRFRLSQILLECQRPRESLDHIEFCIHARVVADARIGNFQSAQNRDLLFQKAECLFAIGYSEKALGISNFVVQLEWAGKNLYQQARIMYGLELYFNCTGVITDAIKIEELGDYYFLRYRAKFELGSDDLEDLERAYFFYVRESRYSDACSIKAIIDAY
jgi:tetratricopeptide (TPR) repeat protein